MDSIHSLSYVSLNRGDDNVVSEQITKNRRGIRSAIFYTISGLVINIVSSYLAVKIGIN